MTDNPILKGDRLWTKYYILIILVSFSANMLNFTLTTTLPLYVMNIGGNNSSVGLLMTFFCISALIVRPVFGNIMDIRSRKAVLLAGLIILMLVSLLYNLAFSVTILMVLRVVNGVGFSAVSTAAPTIVTDISPASRLPEGISYFGISMTAAMAVGPVIGLNLLGHFGFRIIFIFSFIIGIVGFTFMMMINYEKENKKRKEINPELLQKPGEVITADRRRLNISNLFEKTSIKPSLVQFFIAFSYGSVFTFIPAYGVSRGIDNIGVFFTVYAGAVILATIGTGKLVERYGVGKVFLPGLLLQFTAFFLLAFAHSLPVVLIAGTLFGLGSGANFPVINIIVIKLCPVKRRGAANATLFSAMDIGIGLGALLWGIVSEKAGFMAVYLAAAAVLVIALLAFFLVLHGKVSN